MQYDRPGGKSPFAECRYRPRLSTSHQTIENRNRECPEQVISRASALRLIRRTNVADTNVSARSSRTTKAIPMRDRMTRLLAALCVTAAGLTLSARADDPRPVLGDFAGEIR